MEILAILSNGVVRDSSTSGGRLLSTRSESVKVTGGGCHLSVACKGLSHDARLVTGGVVEKVSDRRRCAFIHPAVVIDGGNSGDIGLRSWEILSGPVL